MSFRRFSFSANRGLYVWLVFLVIVVAPLVFLVLHSPSRSGDIEEDRLGATPIGTNPALIKEALEFGKVVLPPGAVVLAADRQHGQDVSYRLAVAMPPVEVEVLMRESQFTAALYESRERGGTPLPGFDLEHATNSLFLQERLPKSAGKSQIIYRTVVVDIRDPARSVVHLQISSL